MHILIRHKEQTFQSAEVDGTHDEMSEYITKFTKSLNAGASYSQNLNNGSVLVLGPLATQEATYEFVLTKPAKVKKLT